MRVRSKMLTPVVSLPVPAVVGTAISGTAGSGSYCVRIYDGGNIADPNATVTYTVQVQHY